MMTSYLTRRRVDSGHDSHVTVTWLTVSWPGNGLSLLSHIHFVRIYCLDLNKPNVYNEYQLIIYSFYILTVLFNLSWGNTSFHCFWYLTTIKRLFSVFFYYTHWTFLLIYLKKNLIRLLKLFYPPLYSWSLIELVWQRRKAVYTVNIKYRIKNLPVKNVMVNGYFKAFKLLKVAVDV